MMKSNRITQLDILKGIGIIFVMFGHAIPPNTFFYSLIYGFHMPLFFMCSGYFYKDVSIWQGLKKDFKGLLVPWFTFVLFLCLSALIINWMSSNKFAPDFNLLDEHCWLLYYTIWFLVCLFIVRQIYRVLFKLNQWFTVSCAWGGYFIAYYLKQYNINIPFFVDSAMAMLIFFHVGYLFKKHSLHEKQPIWVSITLLLIYAIFVWSVHPYVNIKDNVFPLYLVALSVVPTYALYQLCCRINSKILILCGIESLSIMGFHHPIYDTIMYPLMSRLSLPLVGKCFFMVLFTLVIVLVLNRIISKYTPFLLGKF